MGSPLPATYYRSLYGLMDYQYYSSKLLTIGFLTISILRRSPKPYSNYEGPYSTHLRILFVCQGPFACEAGSGEPEKGDSAALPLASRV